MKINITEITHGFAPAVRYVEARSRFRLDLHETKISSDALYSKIEALTALAYPSYKDKFDTKWHDFYLPMKRAGRLITVPMSVTMYESVFYVSFGLSESYGYLAVDRGSGYFDEFYLLIVDEAIRFVPTLKQYGIKLVERTYPYDLRLGKIKGKYVFDELMPEEERQKIEEAYRGHLKKHLTLEKVSLNEYLETASICYRAGMKREALVGMTPLQMYRKWADTRHGGMMDIKDPDSKQEYMEWLNSSKW
jgi:hypothetical protein